MLKPAALALTRFEIIVFLELHELFLQARLDVLDEGFLLIKWIVIVFNKGSTRRQIQHELFADQVLAADLRLEQRFQQQVADTCIDQILLLPWQLDE